MKHLSKAKFFASSNIDSKLINAIINHAFGGWSEFKEGVQDCANYGCSGGSVSGMIYYKDTVAFAEKYFELILKLMQNQAYEYGQDDSVTAHVLSCSNNRGSSIGGILVSDIEDCFILRNKDNEWYQSLFNWLAWYATEVVCQEYVDLCEQGE